MNKSGIRPLEYFVLVEPRQVEEKTSGGLYIPESTKEREQFGQTEGVLVDMSPMAFNFDDTAMKCKPGIGARVMFSKYQATEVRGQDGKTYWLMKDKAIAAEIIGNDG